MSCVFLVLTNVEPVAQKLITY